MDINVDELDYSKYKLPYDISEDYRTKEWYAVGNMESNYRYALAVVKGEIK